MISKNFDKKTHPVEAEENERTKKGFSVINQVGAASGAYLVCNNCNMSAEYSSAGHAEAAKGEVGVCPACGNQKEVPKLSDNWLARIESGAFWACLPRDGGPVVYIDKEEIK